MARLDNLVFENADIVFRNFAGREAQFNSEGDRNFCILLDPKKAESMLEEGWNVKNLRPREEGDEPQSYVQVAVNFSGTRPPKVVLITSKGRNDMDSETVAMLDYADIGNVDVILNPYEWEVNGKKGVKAYLKACYVTLNEDPLELKYAELEDAQDPRKSLTDSTVNESADDDEEELIDV